MNSLERVFAAAQGKPKDRIPVTAMLSLYGAGLISCPLKEYYNNPVLYAEGQQAVNERFRPDILFSPFNFASLGEVFGNEIRYYTDTPPNIETFSVKNPEAILQFDMNQFSNHQKIRFIHESTHRMALQSGKETAITGVFLSPADLPMMILGIDIWLETVLFNPDLAKEIIRCLGGFFIEQMSLFFEEGAHLVALPVGFCNPSIITPFILETVLLPDLITIFEKLKGPVILHHTGAPVNSILSVLNRLPNVAGFLVDSNDHLEESRTLIGAGKVILGNIDGPTLIRKSPEKIASDAEKILQNRFNDPSFILATSAADVPLNTHSENIQAFFHAVQNQ